MSRYSQLPVANVDLSGKERDYLLEAFDSGWLSGAGPFVKRFEDAFAEFCGTLHALTCANGTVALHLALMALDLKPGDEVIVPSLTYIATANAVRYCGATPVFADCDANTWNAGAEQILPLIGERTKGIIVVHLYGNPVDMDPVMNLAAKHGLWVVEDAAEAHGASYHDRSVGTIGNIATFSFYGNKIMTTGEGGMVTTANADLAEKVRLLRGQGMDPERRYWFPVVGYNYRLSNLQCALGLAQLERADQFIAARKHLAERYNAVFAETSSILTQAEQPGGGSVWWMYGIVMPSASLRTKAMDALANVGIETRPFFHPIHDLPPYRASNADCPQSLRLGACGLSLPSGAHVDEADIERIHDVLVGALHGAGLSGS